MKALNAIVEAAAWNPVPNPGPRAAKMGQRRVNDSAKAPAPLKSTWAPTPEFSHDTDSRQDHAQDRSKALINY